MIPLKPEKDLEVLRQSGHILARVMKKIQSCVRPGITTAEIDAEAENAVLIEKALPAFKGYRGFPSSVCTSINEEIVHGIPSERKLLEGDIISLDFGVNYSGFFTDAAITLPVGKISPEKKKLIEVARKALAIGVKQAKAGNRLSDISYSIQNFVESNGFSVVRQFVGHGIGRALHEDPEIPNFGRPNLGPVLENGMVLAIEPMINMGGWESEITENGWTAVTKDGLASAHFEHTVAITQKGPEVLTI
ncbi:MAG: type I methionyl aminopeptidase [Candidatus Omnitrophica bacterium]|nr:type I methionyl aminopeptidase [Candidatus Omnitrophota bacterium]MBU1869188.1 type I methionyl aminopeptidase [Candidatus Omnitrophota bacterium]